ncbi:MAG: tRNA adenosine(34) deaminase TadA [Erysipelotrichaceae bacterium]|nr:tRNA adenosine(34) deaminase TadA [Erysipelotrichaceae bacterium]
MDDIYYMREAIKQAKKAEQIDDVPVGAVIVLDGKIIARGYNKRTRNEQTADHAEMIAIRKACKKVGSWRLEDCTMYVTLEPCPMCAGAIFQSRIKRVVFGASDLKAGALGSKMDLFSIEGLNHYPEIEGGILEEECSQLLKQFFKKLRNKPAK